MTVQERATTGLRAGAGSGEAAISVCGLVKSFGDVRALDGVDLEAPAGHRARAARPQRRGQDDGRARADDAPQPDAGEVRVAGLDAVRDAAELREQIGLAGQYAAVDENLTGAENL